MAKLCPNCNIDNEDAALSCECGTLFVNDIEASQSREMNQVQQLRRGRLIKKTAALTCCVVLSLAVVAYSAGYLSPQANADSEVAPQAETKPVMDAPQMQFVSNNPRFPEVNVPYKAVRAITGSVINVIDANNQEHRVTLHGIRVPKLDENFGIESKLSLSNFVVDKPVMIRLRKFTKDVDTIAEVYSDGANIGLEQIRSGMALLAPEEMVGLSESEQRDYLDAAVAAKSAKLGIWSGKKGVNPITGEPGDWSASNMKLNTTEPAGELPYAYKEPVKRQTQPGGMRSRPLYEQEYNELAQPEAAPPAIELPAPKPVQEAPAQAAPQPKARSSSGRTYMRGPQGGCFYINSGGNKSYVDRSMCN